MKQYGFFLDTSRCTGCNACVIACKQYRNIEPGPAKPIRVYQWEKGVFPDLDVRVLPIMCFHCAQPRCKDACEHGAIYKEDTHGAVLVDPDKCMGDRNCFEACPYGTPQFLSDDPREKMLKCDMCIDRLKEGNAPLCVLSCSLRALDFGPLDELRTRYGDTGCYIPQGEAPCHNACPGAVDIERYLDLTAKGDYAAALETVYETTPFAGILGRVCTRPCEIDCFRGRFDDATSIREIKRFLADWGAEHPGTQPPQNSTLNGKTVAVVGAGPTGLSCAYQLARRGYAVTVYDREAAAGGMMRYGIPSYRLPRDVLDREIGFIQQMGVTFLGGHEIQDLSELERFDAIFVATGAGQGVSLNVPGGNSTGIMTAVEFLRGVNTGGRTSLDGSVVVIGGGSVAIDAARTAVRLGAPSVHLVCLEGADPRGQDPMPAQEDEVREAQEEGVLLHDRHGVQSFTASGSQVQSVHCVRCLSVWDESGRFAPRYAQGEATLQLQADLVLLALGQRAPEAAYPVGLPRQENGRAAVSSVFQTAVPRIFAGGDLLSGTADIITSVAVGNEAAESIDRFCRGLPVDQERRTIPKSARPRVEKRSQASASRPAEARRLDFQEVCSGFCESDCREHSDRCLHCGAMQPSAVIRREQPKRSIIPWDKWQAIALWSKRHPDSGDPLPDVVERPEDVLMPDELPSFGRSKLMLKARTSEEKLFYTTDDE